ncbi:MAG: helix-turn-helix transcriptional regulator [Myxococcota bacterium]
MNHEGKVSEAVSQGVPVEASPSVSRERDVEEPVDKPVDKSVAKPAAKNGAKKNGKARKRANHLKKFREEQCLSQAELARRANLSALTIARIEKGFGCRMSTKRKILEALGLSLADRVKVFGEEE